MLRPIGHSVLEGRKTKIFLSEEKMEERKKTLEERVMGARPALKNKKLRDIVRITDSPSAATRLAEQNHYHRNKVLSCNDLAVLKRDFPEEYQKQVALVEEAEAKRAARRMKKAEEIASVVVPPKKRNWRKLIYVGIAVVVCLSLVLVGVLVRGGDDQKTPEQVVEQVATPSPVEELATPSIASIISAPIVYPHQIKPTVGIPNLLAPINGTKDMSIGVVGFSWSSVPEAYFYEFVLSGDPEFKEENIVARVLAPTSACGLVTQIKGGSLKDVCLNYYTSYFWRVRAFNDGMETGGWSNINTFATEAAPPYCPIDNKD